jgi:hypothetical protein
VNKVEAYGYMEAGRLKILNQQRFKAELAALKDMDVHITIKKKGKRSSQQNGYYWSTIVPEVRFALLERGTRLDLEQVHEFLKFHFNKQYIHDDNGEVLTEYGGSTTTLNKTEFSEYISRIMEWASEKLGLAISPAGTQTDMFNLNAA